MSTSDHSPLHLHLSADEVLTTTRAVRKRLDFDRPVPREVLEECLQIALQAPTGSNSQGWQWLFVTDPDTKFALAEIYRRSATPYLSAIGGISPEDVELRRMDKVASSAMYLNEHFHRAPVIMIPLIAGQLDGLPTWAAAGAWGSILPAVWSFLLAARERGLGSSWTTLHLLGDGDKEAAELLGIPDGFTQAGMFPLAYTIGTNFKPAARLPLDPIVHWEQW